MIRKGYVKNVPQHKDEIEGTFFAGMKVEHGLRLELSDPKPAAMLCCFIICEEAQTRAAKYALEKHVQ
jgi:hypothetical protein